MKTEIIIDDRQILDFAKKSPARAEWAQSEALKMAGGHFRKKLRAWIEMGGENWPPMRESTKKLRGDNITRPLFGLGRFVRFKYSRRQGRQRVWIGFMNKRVAAIVRAVQVKRRKRITPEMRRLWAHKGIYLRKSTKMVDIPARPIIEPFWRRHHREVEGYIEIRFFEKFFSKQKPKIGL